MFLADSDTPRVYFQSVGQDFPAALVNGLRQRLKDEPPDAIARVTLIVNTERMARRIEDLMLQGPPSFLPRLMTLGHLERLLRDPPPAPRHDLERRLHLAGLMKPLLKDLPDLAAESSLFALVDSLSALIDEMQDEGVGIEEIARLDVSDQSLNWQFSQTLISEAHAYVSAISSGIDPLTRQRRIVEQLRQNWKTAPPPHPIIIAGSTGSRGTTALLMKTIAMLPQGVVILPGLDTHLPGSIWNTLQDDPDLEDHPQFRFAKLMNDLELEPTHLVHWFKSEQNSVDRNAVISLALRPAPVTDAWLTEGPKLPDLVTSMGKVTLLEAPEPRKEAASIAMRMRAALEDNQRIALITPNRRLGRDVTAALARWNIVPDDSGGQPLHLSPPGLFLRHIAGLLNGQTMPEKLFAFLKHPLCTGGGNLSEHRLYTGVFERKFRRTPILLDSLDDLQNLLGDSVSEHWLVWLQDLVKAFVCPPTQHLEAWVNKLRATAESASLDLAKEAPLAWSDSAGEDALKTVIRLQEHAHHGDIISASDFEVLLKRELSQQEARESLTPHPDVMIWGTLEARVQGADILILGGLNESSWPESTKADPWLNRKMRKAAGLLSPERRIGLSAHDFQQSAGADEVWFTRSLRSDDAGTVPSRWLNRLVNLLSGLPEQGGPTALQNMRNRGQEWIDRVTLFEKVNPQPPAARPAPRPPRADRPRDLSVTEIKSLIRDPYAIYARHCLRLRPMDPLTQDATVQIKGILFHDVFEAFIRSTLQNPETLTPKHLIEIAEQVLTNEVYWPFARVAWSSHIEKIADWFVQTEHERRQLGIPEILEISAHGKLMLLDQGASIRARADRIDLTSDIQAIVYDYKSGSPPTKTEQEHFDKQLLIEAGMIEAGAFENLGPLTVTGASYLGVGSSPKIQETDLESNPPSETISGLTKLITHFLDPDTPFAPRLYMTSDKEISDYDHLARFGEWQDGDDFR